jgi:hypothetical protein
VFENEKAAEESRYHGIKMETNKQKRLAGWTAGFALVVLAVLVAACAHAPVKPFVPDRTTPRATVTTLAWAMQHNDAGLIAECFAPDSRFITRLGGAEGLATVSAASPPGAKEELYWQNLRIVSVTETKPDEAVINAESDYLGEMINILLKKEETGWVVASADAYPLPREARYPTTTTPTGEAK